MYLIPMDESMVISLRQSWQRLVIFQFFILGILKVAIDPEVDTKTEIENVKSEADYKETYDLTQYKGLLPEFYLVSAIGADETSKLYPIDSEWPGYHKA
jgi:hypothetical protein